MKLTHADTTYHINRCNACGRLLTKIEVVDRLENRKPLPICPCGSNSFRPSNPKWWEYGLPRVLRLAAGVVTGHVKQGMSV